MKKPLISEQNLIDLGLCYPDSKTRITYNADADGEMDVLREIAYRQDHWKKIKSTTRLLKKKIVINDWTAQKTNTIITHILWRELFAQHFEIYVWDGQLVNINTLEDLTAVCKKIEPIH